MVESTRKPPREPWYKEMPWMRRGSYVAAFALVTAIAACLGVVDWRVPALAVPVALSLALIEFWVDWTAMLVVYAFIWAPVVWYSFGLPFLARQ